MISMVQFSWVHFSRLASRLRRSARREQLFFRRLTTHFLYDLFQTELVDNHVDTIEQYLKFQYTSFTVISTPHQSNPDTTTSHLQLGLAMRMRNMRIMRICGICGCGLKISSTYSTYRGKKLVFLKGNRSSSHVLSGA